MVPGREMPDDREDVCDLDIGIFFAVDGGKLALSLTGVDCCCLAINKS